MNASQQKYAELNLGPSKSFAQTHNSGAFFADGLCRSSADTFSVTISTDCKPNLRIPTPKIPFRSNTTV